MKRTTAAVLALALLLAVAFLLHRDLQEQKPPPRPPVRPPVVEAPVSAGPGAPTPSTSAIDAAPDVAAPPASPPALTGSVRGVVRFGGPVPRRKFVRTRADPECEKMHGPQLASDEFVVDPYGNLQWAFVHVKSGIAGPVPPAPTTPVLLDQVACVFTPHVLGIRVGQPLLIVNSDNLLHTVHSLPFENKEFNFGLPKSGMEETKRFGKPEVMIKLKCDVHPWMAAWIGVVDHPYFAITNAVGSFVLRDLPPGNYQIEAWHEKCNPVALPIGVGPGRESLLDFVLDEKKQ